MILHVFEKMEKMFIQITAEKSKTFHSFRFTETNVRISEKVILFCVFWRNSFKSEDKVDVRPDVDTLAIYYYYIFGCFSMDRL